MNDVNNEEYLGLTPDGKIRDWPDLTSSVPPELPPPGELGVCYYYKSESEPESISYGLKIIFDIVDPKKDGKIYRISKTEKKEETRFNTRQHIVDASNKYVLIAVNSMDQFNEIVRPVFESPVFQEAILSKGIVIDIITPESIPQSSRETRENGGVLLAVYPTQDYLLSLGEIENITKFVLIPFEREDAQEWIDEKDAQEVVFYFD